jgi:DNA-binding CsgD family transcriptional regulator
VAADGAAIRLLERETELAGLDDAAAAALSGSGRIVVIEGQPGIGKTRLLAAACERAGDLGMEAVSTRAGELERDLGWGVVRQLFERALASVSQREHGECFSGAARLASAVLGRGEDSSLPRSADATAAALHGLYWLTVNLAERGPLLLAVDDAHWADPPSLRWLCYLAVRVEELPVLLAVTVREGEPGADLDFVGVVAAQSAAQVLRPAPLSEQASEHVIRAALGRRPDPEFARACQAAAGGNPFLLGELARDLARARVPPTAAQAARVREVRPEGIARNVAERLSRLPAEARELAAAVAVLGSRASLRYAADLAALDDEGATAAADTLVGANILHAGVPLEFCHPIVRTAVYSELPAIRRAEWHRRAAGILGAAGRPADEVVVHLLAVEPRGDPSVVERLRAAAEDALARGAVQAAVVYLRRALAEPPPPEVHADTLRALGSAEGRLVDPGAIEHLREALELERDAGERARTAHELAKALLQGLRSREAVELLERALSTVAEVDREMVLELEAELAAIAYLDVAAAPMVFERIRRLLPEVEEGRTPAERLVLSQLANQLAHAGASAEHVGELAARALGDGRLLAEQTADSLSLHVVVYALVLADRFELAEAALDDAIADARARGSAVGFAMASSVRSELDYGRGAVADSVAEARNSIEAREPPLPNALGWLVRALVERGELEAAARVLRESPYGEELPHLLTFTNLLHAHGELLVAQGKTRQGLELFLEVLRRTEPLGPRRVIAVEAGLAATIAFGALGDTAEARRRAADAVERARAWGTASLLGRCLRVQGLVEGGREGIERLSEAVSLLVESPRRLEHARALVDLGAALRRAGHRREARDPLRQGLDLAYACGATALLERARTELRAAGARPRRVRLTGVDALTPSERRVAEMAAQGLTNREIAQALFVTPRTVETHLGHAYQKLDIGSREELRAALATERGQDRALAGA